MASITQEQAQAAYQAWTKELGLTDEQKGQFQSAMDQAVDKLNAMAAAGTTIDGPTAKQAIRSGVESILSPEQLSVWDRGFDKAKSALGL